MAGTEGPTSGEFDYFLDPALQQMGVETAATSTGGTEAGGGPGGTAPDVMLMGQEILPGSTAAMAGVPGGLMPGGVGRSGQPGAASSSISVPVGPHPQTVIGGATSGANVGHISTPALDAAPGTVGGTTDIPSGLSVPLGGVHTSQTLSPSAVPPAGRARRRGAERAAPHVTEGGVQKRGRAALNAEEKAAKDHKRILRNRELARVSNERRKGRIKAMENELQETRATVKRLKESIRELESENEGLKNLLEKH